MQDEAKEIANLSDEDLLSRKHETEKLVHELSTRLLVCNIDLERRLREKAASESRRLETLDRDWSVYDERFRRSAANIYSTLLKRGMKPEEAKRRVANAIKAMEG